MGDNSFGRLFSFTSFGESHGPGIGCIIDGVPPRMPLSEELVQPYLDRRKPGQSRFVTQRREDDEVEILSGVFEGMTTGTPVAMLIRNKDQRSKDYGEIARQFRPGHADFTYQQKYGIRDYRGGGRSSARETAFAWRPARSPTLHCGRRSAPVTGFAAASCRSGRTPSTGRGSTGTRQPTTRSSAPTRSRPANGNPISTASARMVVRPAPFLKSSPTAFRPGSASRSTASWTASLRRR